DRSWQHPLGTYWRRWKRIRGKPRRGPNIHIVAESLARMSEPRRHHPNNPVKVGIGIHFPAEDVRITAKQTTPQAITDHNSFGKPLCLIFWAKDTTQLGLRAKQRKIVGTDGKQLNTFRTIGTCEIRIDWPNG